MVETVIQAPNVAVITGNIVNGVRDVLAYGLAGSTALIDMS